MTLTRGFIRNAAKTPLDARLADMATITCYADGSPRVGVLGSAAAGAIVATTGTMNVTVAASEFVTSKGKADGVAIFTNDGGAARRFQKRWAPSWKTRSRRRPGGRAK